MAWSIFEYLDPFIHIGNQDTKMMQGFLFSLGWCERASGG